MILSVYSNQRSYVGSAERRSVGQVVALTWSYVDNPATDTLLTDMSYVGSTQPQAIVRIFKSGKVVSKLR